MSDPFTDGEIVDITPAEPIDPPEVARGKQLAIELSDLEFETLVRARVVRALRSDIFHENLSASSTYAQLTVRMEAGNTDGWMVSAYQTYDKSTDAKGEILSTTVRSAYRALMERATNKLATLLPSHGG